MRRLSLLILTVLALTACTTKRPAPSPPPPVAPPVTEPVVTPTPSPPAGEVGLKPEPPGGLKELLSPAPGVILRVDIKPGEPIDREGLFFLKIPTGDVEGWVYADSKSFSPFDVSDDSRWVIGLGSPTAYLTQRESGLTHKWHAGDARLITARGDQALFMTGSQFWLARAGLTAFAPVAVPPAAIAQAKIAPDGKTALLVAGAKLYHIETPTGQFREIGQVPALLSMEADGGGVQVSTATGRGDETHTRSFAWDGKLRADRTTPGRAYSSPDGKLLAWSGTVLDLADTITVGTPTLEPRFRLLGELTCSVAYQGPYWLPDSSGLMVNTTQGPRLLRTDGTLLTPKLPEKERGWGVPVPAPDRPDLFAYSGHMVLDGAGKLVAAAVPHSEGRFTSTAFSRIHPWGERSDEVRFRLVSYGKGIGCSSSFFPPAVERAPFAQVTEVEVKVPRGDCVNLRTEYVREAPVVACVGGGTRLSAASPPGANNKGQLERGTGVAVLDMGGSAWWYTRTEKGERGWVYIDPAYLALAAPRPGAPAPDPVQRRLEDEVAFLSHWYRVALGETPCSATCSDRSIETTMAGVLNWCQDGPANLLHLPGFDPARHAAGLAPIEQSCKSLRDASASLGRPMDTAAWRQKLKDLLTTLPR